MDCVVGRFAPTPSGEMHLGNLWCAMASYIAARGAGGRFILRIEDNDTPRCREKYADDIIACLEFFGFRWDGEIVRQSQRGEIYAHALSEISRMTYPCFCSRSELARMDAPNLGDTQRVYSGKCRNLTEKEQEEKTREFTAAGRHPAIRLKVMDETIEFDDMIMGHIRENLARDCGDFVLRRSDGIWGYQLCSTVDDMLQGVNQVVRGWDILTSTPRQIYLRRLLHGEDVQYCHIPLLLSPDGSRLAKRDNSTSVMELTRTHTPEEILGKLAYTFGMAQEPKPVTLKEAADKFDVQKIKAEPEMMMWE